MKLAVVGAGYWGVGFDFSKIDPNTLYLAGTTVYRASLASPFVGNNLWVTSFRDPDGYRIDFESPSDVPEETEYTE